MKKISRQERLKKLKRWSKGGYCACPKCDNSDLVHITIHDEGEKLICKACKYFEIVGEEFTKERRGFSLEG